MVLTVGCSSIYGVSYDYNEDTNFAHLRTYGWLAVTMNDVNEEMENIDSINLRRIRDAVSDQLVSKGLNLSSDKPDFLIAVYLRTKERLIVTNYGAPYAYPYDGYGPYWSMPTIRQYE